MCVEQPPAPDTAEGEFQELQQGSFQKLQQGFAAHLRAPQEVAAPAEIESRRMGIYRDLIYNNIESFIAGGFPVLRSLYGDEPWHRLVRDFVQRHRCKSPYFLEISQEFLHYLEHERADSPDSANDPAFLRELAHYEWVELALDVSEETFPPGLVVEGDRETVLELSPVLSPLAWSLSYQFPVHRIGPTFQPVDPPQMPTFLVAYRNRADTVAFLEANAVTARLLQLAEQAPAAQSSGRQLLQQLARELQHPDPVQLEQFGAELLLKLLNLDILAGLRRP
ncbi:putative DNA-binding domain-containing protein [uncultured Microbulbifer sp.]|uniref:HvfC family RiPP maturation protein n=1 Tax=uncultured Microbulbifer sp. TaxID=348147 RepID=UPI0025D71820|nr:putative DNA-binding domain-containing protein [uncultured Microbulbifer sp.]